MTTIRHVISVDTEANGLHGQIFSVAMTLSDRDGEIDSIVLRCPMVGEPTLWVARELLPAMAHVPENCASYPEMVQDARWTYQAWGGGSLREDIAVVAYVPWPLECRLFSDMYPDVTVLAGPFPLVDVASMLIAKGRPPIPAERLEDYVRDRGGELPKGGLHDPLYDARLAAVAYWLLVEEANR